MRVLRSSPLLRLRSGDALLLPALAFLFAVTMTAVPGPAAAARLASILVDATDGRVLQTEEADTLRYPASLTKMMTLYMAFEALDEGRVTLDQPLWVSAHAAAQPPTKLGLRAGQSIVLETAMLGLVTKSANDAAAVLAENLAGSEDNFAVKMTGKAHALGMTQTVFRNASGLPDPNQVTSARDMATLALALLHHFPHYYHYFSVKEFQYRGRPIANHNRLLGVYEGVDGIKTGYTRASGFNLVASVQRGDRRLIGVVLGAPSSSVRNAMMADLFDQAYRGSPQIQLASVGQYLGGAAALAGSGVADAIAGTRQDVAYRAPSALVSRDAVSAATERRRYAASLKAERRRAQAAAVAERAPTCGRGRKAKACPTLAKSTTTKAAAKQVVASKAKTKTVAAKTVRAPRATAAKSTGPVRTVAAKPTAAAKAKASAAAKPQPAARGKAVKAAATTAPAQLVARKSTSDVTRVARR